MLSQAPPDPRITYRVAEAEGSGLEGGFVDLVTVASAIHWFDLRRFYAEVRRVVKPGGTVAAWTYYTPVFGGDIEAVIQRLVHEVLGPYWDERLHYVVDEFQPLGSFRTSAFFLAERRLPTAMTAASRAGA